MIFSILPATFSLFSLVSNFQSPALLSTNYFAVEENLHKASSHSYSQTVNLKNLGQAAQGGFEIYLTECLPQPANAITCEFVVRNTQDMKELKFRPRSSRMIDSSGTEVMGSSGRFGSEFRGGNCYCTADVDMPKDVRVNGEVTFETNPANDEISYVQMDFIDFMVEFVFLE